jgi:cobalt-zinc-cadmium efflux system protein
MSGDGPHALSREVPVNDTHLNHRFEHGAEPARSGQRTALTWALGVNIALLAAEVVGGIAFGSLALLADAVHLVSDVAGLGIALVAVVLTARPVSRAHSFGFARAEVLAAQLSALLLLGAGIWILVEAVSRWRQPVVVVGAGLALVVGLGLVVNLGSALVVHHAQCESLNMRASFVHLAAAAGSLAALLAGAAIWSWGWASADTVASVATAVLVIWTGWGLLRESTHVLMEGTPKGLALDRIEEVISEIAGVAGVHHLYLWNLASDIPALSTHVALTGDPTLHEAQLVAARVKTALADTFGVINVTLELEDTAPTSARQGSWTRTS